MKPRPQTGWVAVWPGNQLRPSTAIAIGRTREICKRRLALYGQDLEWQRQFSVVRVTLTPAKKQKGKRR